MRGFPCPTCGEEMEERYAKPRAKNLRPPVVRQCPKCWSVFLSVSAQQELGAPAELQRENATETGGRRCPICEREMKLLELRPGVFKKVEVDRCPACRGVLFDPGELPELLGRTVSISADKNDEYLKKDPKRAPSAMGDPRGPWRGDNLFPDNDRVLDLTPLLDALRGDDD